MLSTPVSPLRRIASSSFRLHHVSSLLPAQRRPLSESVNLRSTQNLVEAQPPSSTPRADESRKTNPRSNPRLETSSQSSTDTNKSTSQASPRTRQRKARGVIPKTRPQVRADKTRVNIVSEELCDDILSYIGPSLERHKGCDLIDIYPGDGLWSKKLNECLKPRTHILMEPDIERYRDNLQPLLEKPETTLVPESGIVWRELHWVLDHKYLPHQRVAPASSARANQRNDTLLVTANIAFHPRKTFANFDSVAILILHQFIDSIRVSSLIQRYGQVRMLVWARDEDKAAILPRFMQRRRRAAVEGELFCEYIHEVAGPAQPKSMWFGRDLNIDQASAIRAAKKRLEAGITIPEGRESNLALEAISSLEKGDEVVPGKVVQRLNRRYQKTLEALQGAERGTKEHERKKAYQWRQTSEMRRFYQILELQRDMDSISHLRSSQQVEPDDIRASETNLARKISGLSESSLSEFITYKDNLHYWRQQPPMMHWDRRPFEPLVARSEEFSPDVECTLLDIQPKPVHPLFRQVGPSSTRAGEAFELIMRSLLSQPTQPIGAALESLWPGASDYILPRCTTFQDPEQGGIDLQVKHVQLTPRMLNTQQWEDLLERWHEWPFRPSFGELVARTQDNLDIEEGMGGMGEGLMDA